MSQALMHEAAGERTPAWSPPLAPRQAPLAGKGFWRRSVSYLLDLPIFYLAMQGIGMSSGPVLAYLGLLPHLERALLAESRTSVFILGIALSATYFALFEWQFGATPGKVLTGLRVVSSRGTSCSLGSAYTRALARLADGFIFGAVAGASMRAPYNQRWGDKLANTLVVAASDSGISERRQWWRLLVAAVLVWAASLLIWCTYVLVLTMSVLGA